MGLLTEHHGVYRELRFGFFLRWGHSYVLFVWKELGTKCFYYSFAVVWSWRLGWVYGACSTRVSIRSYKWSKSWPYLSQCRLYVRTVCMKVHLPPRYFHWDQYLTKNVRTLETRSFCLEWPAPRAPTFYYSPNVSHAHSPFSTIPPSSFTFAHPPRILKIKKCLNHLTFPST